jgi:hypothetical protein
MFWIKKGHSKHMADLFARRLPQELVDIVKEFTGEGLWRNGTFVSIGRIAKNDPRCDLLRSRSLIEQVHGQRVVSRLDLCSSSGGKITIRLRYIPISKYYSLYQYEIYIKHILTLFIIK